MIQNAIQTTRQNLTNALAALGIGLAVIVGATGTVTPALEAKAQTIEVVKADGPWEANGIVYGGAVCDTSQGWWAEFCRQHGASPLGSTIIVNGANEHQAYLVGHEARHSLFGRDGPPDDPNNEKEAHAAGCRAEWIPDYCERPQVMR